MGFYKKIDKLAYWFRYQATYLEMAYYLKQVLNGKVNSYIKAVSETWWRSRHFLRDILLFRR